MPVHIPPTFSQGLVGRRITAVVRVDVGGGEEWPGLKLDNGCIVLVQRDPEGNGGGAMSLVDAAGRTVAMAGCDA